MKTSSAKIEFLGSPRLFIDGKEIVMRSKRSFALLAYLCLEIQPTVRKKVEQLLWKSEEQPANDRLRVLLTKLRKHSPDIILTSRTSVALDPDIRQESDIVQFLQLYRDGTITSYKKAISLYSGDFLAKSTFEASGSYHTWLDHQRSVYRKILSTMYIEVVDFLLKNGKRDNDLQDGIDLAHKYLSKFIWSDEMILKLALMYIKSQQSKRALVLLLDYENKIEKEFSLYLPHELSSIKQKLELAIYG